MTDDIEQRFPHECTTQYPYMQVTPWVEENIGTWDRDWYRLGSDIGSGVTGWELKDIYRFRDEKDAVIFKLKWS